MARQSAHRRPPSECPACGADVPPTAHACPGCGSDYQTGWKDDADTSGPDLGLPDENFDYDDYVRREFSPEIKPAGIKPLWWITALLLLLAFVAFYVLGKF